LEAAAQAYRACLDRQLLPDSDLGLRLMKSTAWMRYQAGFPGRHPNMLDLPSDSLSRRIPRTLDMASAGLLSGD